ncbi:alpha-amylase [Poseidonibacter parvus]|uniref:Alpha-amylase n=1 Tax=Poseidonibacter parvus TaxID=1850254 RepID=A0A1P8KL32_9BACT|nr:alpha-amylase [Poseidonibacter parvus]APW65268.1 alpha-amylase [Poseidonibacter parvus]
MANNNHKNNQKNDNRGTSGTNNEYQKMLDNRSNQMNINHPEYKGAKNGK